MFGRREMVTLLREAGAKLESRNRLGLSASTMVNVSSWVGKLLG